MEKIKRVRERMGAVRGSKREFMEFLRDYNVLALSIGIVIGGAVSKLVSSMVDDLVMPLVELLTPGGSWREIVWTLGRAQFGVGNFLGRLVDFLIIAGIVFLVVKKMLKIENIGPVKKTKK